MVQVDLAKFDCNTCGHRCTAPEAINALAHQMEKYESRPLPKDSEGNLITTIVDAITRKSVLETKHPGNTVIIRTEGDEEVTRFARSYARVEILDTATMLEDSKHFRLSCPQCGRVHYKVGS